MASVLFSTVGQAIGGPLGAGVGAAVGATVDASLFRRARQGASDIYVQRSAYGTIVPKLFGTVRTAGQVVWGLPMATGGQPKGSGRTSTSASFAVALSARPILEIVRIWADGREIRSRQGQFENSTQMRLHSAQSLIPDPLIAAFEGVGLTPAFSSLSYVVFEEFDLGPFGNRIPNLSFEIVADRGNASDWLNALAHPVDIATDTSGGVSDVSGYTAGSERLSDDLSTLGVISDAKPGLKGGGLVFCKLPRRFEMDAGDLLVFGTIPGIEPNRTVGNRPTGIAIEYLDSARDYLVSRQQPALVKPGRELSLSLPACASAEAAGSLAAHVLRSAQFGSERLTVGASWRYLEVTVGDEIRIDGGAWWRVLKRDVRGLEIWLEAERVAEPIGRSGVAADPGRQLSAPLVLATPTILVPFEPPVPIQGTTPCLLVAAAGDEAWRGADLSVLANGDEFAIGSVAPGALLGRLAQTLSPGCETIWDEETSILVDVMGGASGLQSKGRDEVLAGANLLLVGDELVQFRAAEFSDASTVRLTGLLRRRFGTGNAVLGVARGSWIAKVGPSSLPALALSPDTIGREIILLASGRGDPKGGTEAIHKVEGRGFAPLAPVHFYCERLPDQGIRSSWISRHRELWAWAAGVDPALPKFIWKFDGDDGAKREIRVNLLSISLTAADQMAMFGGLFGSGSASVEAVGEGPSELRMSGPVRI